MATLNDFIPNPRLREVDSVRVSLPATAAFEAAREFDLARSPLVSALFWIRTLPERLMLSDKRTTAERVVGESSRPPHHGFRAIDFGRAGSGFQVLADERDRLIVGAIAHLWEPSVTFASVAPEDFARYNQPGWGKLAWELRCEDDGAGSRIIVEQRATATDDGAYRKLRRYLRLIGPFSHFIRRHTLALMARELGEPEAADATKRVPGDDVVAEPKATATHAITIDAAPAAVWPWLVHMSCRHEDRFDHDDLDHVDTPREIEELEAQGIALHDVLPGVPEGPRTLTVIAIEEPHVLVLGGLADLDGDRDLGPHAAKPVNYWHASCAFELEPLPLGRTRLLVRTRADFSPSGYQLGAGSPALRLVHHFVQPEQLTRLKRRVEGTKQPAVQPLRDIPVGIPRRSRGNS